MIVFKIVNYVTLPICFEIEIQSDLAHTQPVWTLFLGGEGNCYP